MLGSSIFVRLVDVLLKEMNGRSWRAFFVALVDKTVQNFWWL